MSVSSTEPKVHLISVVLRITTILKGGKDQLADNFYDAPQLATRKTKMRLRVIVQNTRRLSRD